MALEIPGLEDLVEIGRGGFAVVYRGRQPNLDRDVAVKVLVRHDLNDLDRRRFAAETRALGNLAWHPHVVTVHDTGITRDGAPWLSMELLERGSLSDRLDRHGPFSDAEVLRVGVQLASALEVAHRAGFLHRDVKPQNVLLGRSGDVKLADFGIAAFVDRSRSASGAITGTVAHIAPEVLQGARASVATDVYALGSTLYQLLTGYPAYVGAADENALAIMWRTVHDPLPPLPDHVHGPLGQVVEQAMAKDPSSRWHSALGFALALQDVEHGLALPGTRIVIGDDHTTSGPTVTGSEDLTHEGHDDEPPTHAADEWAPPHHREATLSPSPVAAAATSNATAPIEPWSAPSPTTPHDGAAPDRSLSPTAPNPLPATSVARRRRFRAAGAATAVAAVLIIAIVILVASDGRDGGDQLAGTTSTGGSTGSTAGPTSTTVDVDAPVTLTESFDGTLADLPGFEVLEAGGTVDVRDSALTIVLPASADLIRAGLTMGCSLHGDFEIEFAYRLDEVGGATSLRVAATVANVGAGRAIDSGADTHFIQFEEAGLTTMNTVATSGSIRLARTGGTVVAEARGATDASWRELDTGPIDSDDAQVTVQAWGSGSTAEVRVAFESLRITGVPRC